MKNSKWYIFLGKEIGIEYKACLYFFSILVFQSGYLLLQRTFEVKLLHLAEIILTAYFMGYIQTYFLDNVDESPRFTLKVILQMLLCSGIYTAVSFWFCWFDRNITATVGFLFYIMLAYICVLPINRIKRDVDTRELNELLKDFQKNEHRNED